MPNNSFAQLEEGLEYLLLLDIKDTNIVSSTKQEESLFKAPSVVYVITDTQIKQRGYNTVFDLLKHIPGFDFDTPHGGWVGQYSRLRGTRALRHILLLIDGVVQNNINDFENGRLHTFSLKSVKQVEIITSPASALYGANALLGVINIISKYPSEISSTETSYSYTTSLGNESNAFNKHNVFFQFGKMLTQEVGFYTAFELVKNDDEGKDYYDPDNTFKKGTIHSIFGVPEVLSDEGFNNHQDDKYFKLRISREKTMSFGIDYADINEGIGAFLHSGRYFTNSDDIDYLWHTRRFSAFSDMKFCLSDQMKILSKIYYREDQIDNDSGFAYTISRGVFPAGTFRSFKQLASRTGIDINFAYNPVKSISILMGVNIESDQTENEVDSFGFKSDNNTTYVRNEEVTSGDEKFTYPVIQPMFFRKLYSSYLQLQYDINPEIKILTGGRYDKETDTEEQFTPRLGLVYSRETQDLNASHLIFKLLYGESFRALANYEKFDVYSAEGTRAFEGINPEKAKTIEFQTIYLPTERSKYECTLWWTKIKDLKIDGTNAFTIQKGEEKNFGDQTTYGLQAGIVFTVFNNLSWAMNYTYTNGKNHDFLYHDPSRGVPELTEDETLNHIATHKINSNLNYYFNDYFNINMAVKYVGERYADPTDAKFGKNEGYDFNGDGFLDYHGNGKAPGYLTVDLNLSCGIFHQNGWSYNLLITNLFNDKYIELSRSHSDFAPRYHPQPGRRVELRARWLWN